MTNLENLIKTYRDEKLYRSLTGDLKIQSLSIKATTRKLKARWTAELTQDLEVYHSEDTLQQLTSTLYSKRPNK